MIAAPGLRILRRLFPFIVLATMADLRAQTAAVLSPAPKPGDIERSAIAKADFLIGEWRGEGWILSSGQKLKFWVDESYRYRGTTDLLDMEGRFGGILPDGNRLPQDQYALGILFYDRATAQYQMWHYSDGNMFVTPVVVDVPGRGVHYFRKNERGESSRFSLKVGEDGFWISKREILQPDGTWHLVMEFRMTRVP